MNVRCAAAAALLSILTVAPAVAQAPPPAAVSALGIDLAALPRPVEGVEGVPTRLFKDGRVYIAGQPSEAALKQLRERGVTLDVTLRTNEELADRKLVSFDEAATAGTIGVEFLQLPIGGDAMRYRPEVLDRLHEALERHTGPVLLHCASGVRASYVWAAYLVKYGGLTIDQAMARGRAIGIAEDPVGQLLARPTALTLGDGQAKTSAPPPPLPDRR